MSDVGYAMDDGGGTVPPSAAPVNDNAYGTGDPPVSDAVKKQVGKWIKTVKEDKAYHKKAMRRMKRDMRVAFRGWDGTDDKWNESLYVANISGRHVKQKTAQLYAKNPRIIATRRDTMDFTIWDETPETLRSAIEAVQTYTQAMNQMQASAQVTGGLPLNPQSGQPMDPNTVATLARAGQPQPPPPPMSGATSPLSILGSAPPPSAPEGAILHNAPGDRGGVAGLPIGGQPGMAPSQLSNAGMMGHNGGPPMGADPLAPMAQAVQMAQMVIADYQQGMVRRAQIKKLGRTLEILFKNAMRTQRPMDFKKGMKGCVRRTTGTGVGYVEVLFQRKIGPSILTTAALKDARARLDHLQYLMKEQADNEISDDDPEVLEIQQMIQDLKNQQDVVLVEGLVYDYPTSTSVVPDKLCTSLDGFIGARHVTIEYKFTCEQVEEQFGVDLKQGAKYQGYNKSSDYGQDGDDDNSDSSGNYVADEQGDLFGAFDRKKKGDLVCVWKIYDKPSGMVYYVADGYDQYLREPASPDVTVDTFWPLYALTFNETESEDELFPMSDVALMRSQQKSINRSRQGKAEHRDAARPRWMYKNGALEEDDIEKLSAMKPFEALGINAPENTKLSDLMDVIKVPGVDPNLYDTNEAWTDVQTIVGSTAAQLGGASPDVTATQSQLSAGAQDAADSASVDELDAFLTQIAQASGAILLKEMSPEKVLEIVGPGAFWPDLDNEQIMDEIFLEVEAGSMGKPNQQLELANFQKMMPFMMQMPGIAPSWLAKETVRRLDDDVDLTEALSSGVPSIVAQNALVQAKAMIGGPAPGGGPAPPGGAAGGGPAAQGPQGAAQGSAGAHNGPGAPPPHQQGSTGPMGANPTGPGIFG